MKLYLGRIQLGITISRVIWLMFCFVMVGMLVLASRYLWFALACQRWPSTEGIIQSANEVTSIERNNHQQAVGHSYAAELRYSYRVGGIAYVGTRVSFGDFAGSSGSQAGARERLARYTPGKVVSVYYEPADPGRSVLETRITWPNVVFPIVFALLALLGWTGFRRGWRLWLRGQT